MKRTLRSQHDFETSILRNQLTSLILFEAVTTTRAKAAKLEAFANHFFARVRSADMNAVRLANQVLFDQNAAKKTFEELLPRYAKTATSFVRVLRVMPRAGDSAEMRLVLLQKPLGSKVETKISEETEKTAKAAPKKAAAKKAKK